MLVRNFSKGVKNCFPPEYIENQRLWLLARRESKSRILRQGGEIALLHSPSDITRIDFALTRIAEGQYGICAHCGVIIEIERLDFQPETPFCSVCQVEVETRTNRIRN